MSAQFPNPCNRCGMCCMIELCPIGHEIFGGEKRRPCPALEWNGTESGCGLLNETRYPLLAKSALGIGNGCDLSAKVMAGSTAYDFASLPDETKTMLAQQHKEGTIPMVRRKK